MRTWAPPCPGAIALACPALRTPRIPATTAAERHQDDYPARARAAVGSSWQAWPLPGVFATAAAQAQSVAPATRETQHVLVDGVRAAEANTADATVRRNELAGTVEAERRSRLEVAEQFPALHVALEAAATFGLDGARQLVAAHGSVGRVGLGRPHPVDQHVLSFARRRGHRLRLRGGGGEDSRQRPGLPGAANRGSATGRGWCRPRGARPPLRNRDPEVLGEQGAQERRHRDQRRCMAHLRVAPDLLAVTAERALVVTHLRCPSTDSRPPRESGARRGRPGAGTARPTTEISWPCPRSGRPIRTPV